MGIDPGVRGKKEKKILKSGAKGRIFARRFFFCEDPQREPKKVLLELQTSESPPYLRYGQAAIKISKFGAAKKISRRRVSTSSSVSKRNISVKLLCSFGDPRASSATVNRTRGDRAVRSRLSGIRRVRPRSLRVREGLKANARGLNLHVREAPAKKRRRPAPNVGERSSRGAKA